MQLACYRGKSMLSRAIRFVTRSPYSHIAIILSNGDVIEAWDGGVRRAASLSAQHTPGTVVDVFNFREPLSIEQEISASEFLINELNSPYDWKGVFRFITRSSGENDANWFCSELAFVASQRAGRLLFNMTQPWEVPPDWIPRSPLLVFAYQTKTQ